MQCSGSLSAPDSSPSSYQNAQVRPEGDDFFTVNSLYKLQVVSNDIL
jgi:hypothetical protein